ncbi:MAG: Minf_1886 family protein [Candidatus Latescibacterota bacterium]
MPKVPQNELPSRIEAVSERDGRYRREAYFFLYAALDFTLSKMKAPRHVTGRELLIGISEYARKEYGPMVKLVFECWGISQTEDFGNIVFLLVEAGLMGKTQEDRIEDFRNVYEFDEEFG